MSDIHSTSDPERAKEALPLLLALFNPSETDDQQRLDQWARDIVDLDSCQLEEYQWGKLAVLLVTALEKYTGTLILPSMLRVTATDTAPQQALAKRIGGLTPYIDPPCQEETSIRCPGGISLLHIGHSVFRKVCSERPWCFLQPDLYSRGHHCALGPRG